MDTTAQAALKSAILNSLPLLRESPARFQEQYLVWTKQENGWRGEFQLRPNIGLALAAAHKKLEKFGSEFAHVFFKAHPEYAGLVGFPGLGAQNLSHDKVFLLRSILGNLWERHRTFEVDEAAVDAIVNEFCNFVDRPNVKFRFQAELLNFRMPESLLPFAGGLRIRRLTEEEVSVFSGGPVSMLGFHRPTTAGIHEFVIEGCYEQEKFFGQELTSDQTRLDEVKSLLDRAILSLRTFKEGRVGYDWIRHTCLTYCPISVASFGGSDLHVPAGSYEVTEADIDRLVAHAERIFAITEPSMETACRRLADAETRSRAEDQIIDAVIGMEALLLAALGREDRRSELKYRFSINYSSLFQDPSDRRQAFKVAKDLYDLRSTLAHGSDLGQAPHRIGEERLSLIDAANRAREALRTVINRFLKIPEEPIYKKSDFWEDAYFGLRDIRQVGRLI
jgi:hypothetical protein